MDLSILFKWHVHLACGPRAARVTCSLVVRQFQDKKPHFAGNADVSSAMSAKREIIQSYDKCFAPVGALRTGRPRSQHKRSWLLSHCITTYSFADLTAAR